MKSHIITASPLSLYVHIPWCIQKCPYCDFNSHGTKGRGFDESGYVDALIRDLEETVLIHDEIREIDTIFFGGGTPSLFSGDAIARFLTSASSILPFSRNIEITLEANPGTVDSSNFNGYFLAGVNRLSIGIQSFDDNQLKKLGRIHSSEAARQAVEIARQAGFENINIDIMFGLPEQTVDEAIFDVEQGIALGTPHLSYYQLTLEPNTVFYRHPPAVPDDEFIIDISEQTFPRLRQAGFNQYEVSAWTRGPSCRHNLNYWQHADYIGIGAGAHGKLTRRDEIVRTEKPRSPNGYLKNVVGTSLVVSKENLVFEFMLNTLRLRSGFRHEWLTDRGKIINENIDKTIDNLVADELLERTQTHVRCTEKGFLFVNEILLEFLP